VSGGDHLWFKRSTGKKRPVTSDDDDDDDDDNNNNNKVIQKTREQHTRKT